MWGIICIEKDNKGEPHTCNMDLNRIRGKCVASKTKEVHAFIVGPQKSHFKNQVAITLKGQTFTVTLWRSMEASRTPKSHHGSVCVCRFYMAQGHRERFVFSSWKYSRTFEFVLAKKKKIILRYVAHFVLFKKFQKHFLARQINHQKYFHHYIYKHRKY